MPSSARLAPVTQASKVFRVLCLLLSGKPDQVDWSAFSASDWELLTQISHTEGVAPLLHTVFARLECADFALPRVINHELVQCYYHNAAYNANLISELDGALAALTSAGVPIILLKGAALVKTLYAEPAERSMNDLDILIRRSSIHQAVRALRMAGTSAWQITTSVTMC